MNRTPPPETVPRTSPTAAERSGRVATVRAGLLPLPGRLGSVRRAPRALVAVLALVAGLAFGASTAFAAAPVFTVDPSPTAAYTSAHVSGTIDPGENEVFYVFQYAIDPETEGWSSGPQIFTQTLAANSGSTAISEELVGLKPGAEYKLRLWSLTTDFTQEFTSEAPYTTFKTEAIAEPTLTLDPVTTHTATTAHISGTVDTNAPAGPLSEAAKAAFKTEWHFECTPECPGLAGGTVEAEEGLQPVSVDGKGLQPNTAYEVRLVASNGGGSATAGPETFSTDLISPSVSIGPVGSDGHGGALLEGSVNPHNSEVTACHFEYGTTAGYGNEVACVGTPGAANNAVPVTARLTGLTAGAPYHYRLTAVNGAGPASSADATFLAPMPSAASGETCPNEAIREEQHTTFLPECRAYETWAPAFAQGFGSIPAEFADGALGYLSEGNFAGGGNGGINNQYLATRSATGWVNTGLVPRGPTYQAISAHGALAISSDLRSSLWLMQRVDVPTAAFDFYLRDNSSGVMTRVGTGLKDETVFFGTSHDLSHIVFSYSFLAGEAEFEFVGTGNEGAARQVNVDNAGATTPGDTSCFNTISADGRVTVFTAGCDGGGLRQVWARVGGTTSVDVSASQCTRTSSDPGGTCNGPSDADYAGSAGDGSRVFFTTAHQLVNGDTNNARDLYACDIPSGVPTPVGTANPCDALIDITDAAPDAKLQQVVTISEDGSHVYFTAQGVLAANLDYAGDAAQAGDENLYLWQKDAAHPAGTITFVADGGGQGWTTADGHYLLLSTVAALLPTDTDGVTDFYRFDSQTGQMVRISTAASGVGGNSAAGGVNASQYLPNYSPMTSDASTIVFETSEALTPADTNGGPSVYAWHNGNVSLISQGGGLMGITPSGSDIYFGGADARIDGGFKESHSVPCSGEGCQPAASGAPAAPGAPASTALSSDGNITPAEPSPERKTTKPPTRAQKLAKALKACRKDRGKHRRAACEAQAHRRYGAAKHKAKLKGAR